MSQRSLPSLRLILFTTQPPKVVNALIEAFKSLGQQVLLVVTSRDHLYAYYGIITHLSRDQDILVTSRMDRLPAMLTRLTPDLIFCAGFPMRFSAELLALPHLGCVNAHASLLPKYRGPRPLFWQLMHGETQTGMTFHRMESDFCTGPILVQRKLAIAPDDDSRSMWDKFLQLEVSMLPELLALVAAETQGTPQPLASASYMPWPGAAERQLDWTRPATHLHNQIRALAWEGVQALIDGQVLQVYRARVVDSPKVSAAPGTLLACTAEGMLIQTGQDALMVTGYLSEDQIRRFAFSKKPY